MHPAIDQLAAGLAEHRDESSQKVRDLAGDYLEVMGELLGDLGLTHEQIGAVNLICSGSILGQISEDVSLLEIIQAIGLAGAYLMHRDPTAVFTGKRPVW